MIEIRKRKDGSVALVLTATPPDKPDTGIDPALANLRLFEALARSRQASD